MSQPDDEQLERDIISLAKRMAEPMPGPRVMVPVCCDEVMNPRTDPVPAIGRHFACSVCGELASFMTLGWDAEGMPVVKPFAGGPPPRHT